MANEQKEKLIAKALATPEGRLALSGMMTNPITYRRVTEEERFFSEVNKIMEQQ